MLKYDYWRYKPALFSANGRIYFYFEKKIHKYENGEFVVYKDLSNSNVNGMKIVGRSINDFFINTSEGIGHYNGTDLKTIYKTNETVGMFDAAIFKKEVFFLVSNNTYNKYYVVKGILQ